MLNYIGAFPDGIIGKANVFQAEFEQPLQLVQKAIKETAPIPKDYTADTSIAEQRTAHEQAKDWLIENLQYTGADVSFVRPPKVRGSFPESKNVDISNPVLDPSIFTYSSADVGPDIQRDGNRTSDEIVIYTAASQFNGCEAPTRYTVEPGNAVSTYEGDHTQGPQAQLAFGDEQVELINCGGNRGFNGLVHVLDDSTRSAISSGYLTPKTQAEADEVLRQLRENGHLLECPCIGNIPKGGRKLVYQFLTSAAAFGGYSLDWGAISQATKDEIQFLCALHSLRAQFAQAIKMAKESGKPVTLKTAGMGLGVFGSNSGIFSKAYYEAAKEFEPQLKQAHVKVEFQVFHREIEQGYGKALKVTQKLSLQQQQQQQQQKPPAGTGKPVL